jgi:hypothetical protein
LPENLQRLQIIEAEVTRLTEAEPNVLTRSESNRKRAWELQGEIWALQAAGEHVVATDKMIAEGAAAFHKVFDEYIIQEDEMLRNAPGFIDESSVVDIYWKKVLEEYEKDKMNQGLL